MNRNFNSTRRALYSLRTDPFIPPLVLGYLLLLLPAYGPSGGPWAVAALVWAVTVAILSKSCPYGHPRWLAKVLTPNFFSVRLLSGRWGIYQRRRKHRGALDCRQLLKELVADQVRLPAALEPGRYRAVTHDTVLRRLRRMEYVRNLVVTPVYMADMKRIHAAMVGKRCKKCRERCPFPAQDTPRQFYDIRFEIIKSNEKGVRW